MSTDPTPALDLNQPQPPVRPRGDCVGDIPEPKRHARLLAALRALLELPARTRHDEPEG
jgi:hypothetical protein